MVLGTWLSPLCPQESPFSPGLAHVGGSRSQSPSGVFLLGSQSLHFLESLAGATAS